MTPAVLFVVLEVVAGCVIAWQSVAHLNRMSRRTRLPVVVGWVLLGGAAAATVAAVRAATATGPRLLAWTWVVFRLGRGGRDWRRGPACRGEGGPEAAGGAAGEVVFGHWWCP